MKTKIKTSPNKQNNSILENSNFLNSQNYVTLGKDYRFLNYYAFNNFVYKGSTKIIRTTKKNMKKFLYKKLKYALLITFIFIPFYILNYYEPFVFIFTWFLIIINLLVLYSFIYFLFNKKKENYSYLLDKKTYIIKKK